MSTEDVIIFSIVIALVSFSFYRKYAKKRNSPDGEKAENGSMSSSGSGKEDDYEPYSKK